MLGAGTGSVPSRLPRVVIARGDRGDARVVRTARSADLVRAPLPAAIWPGGWRDMIHPSDEQLEDFVLDPSIRPVTVAIEAHLHSCGPCRARLQREALIEVQLGAIARANDYCLECARPVRA